MLVGRQLRGTIRRRVYQTRSLGPATQAYATTGDEPQALVASGHWHIRRHSMCGTRQPARPCMSYSKRPNYGVAPAVGLPLAATIPRLFFAGKLLWGMPPDTQRLPRSRNTRVMLSLWCPWRDVDIYANVGGIMTTPNPSPAAVLVEILCGQKFRVYRLDTGRPEDYEVIRRGKRPMTDAYRDGLTRFQKHFADGGTLSSGIRRSIQGYHLEREGYKADLWEWRLDKGNNQWRFLHFEAPTSVEAAAIVFINAFYKNDDRDLQKNLPRADTYFVDYLRAKDAII